MTFDPHPIVVHFPIALLTLYAIFELIRYKKITDKPYWFYIKATLSIFGFLGALAALATGYLAIDGNLTASRIIEMHFRFALMTNIIFGILALHYTSRWMKHEGIHTGFLALPNWLVILLAFLGLAAITITGGLGGAMVYGTDFDPFMAPIFRLLGV